MATISKPVETRRTTVEYKPPRRPLISRGVMAYLMVLPALLVIVAVVVYPVGQAFWLSLHDIDLRYPQRGEPLVGFQNYADALQNPRLHDAFRFTTIFALLSVGLEVIFGIVVALVLNKNFPGRSFVRALVLIPWSLTTVVVGRMWNLIYNSEYGVLNSILKSVGIIKENQLWTANDGLTFWAVIVADVWKATPFVALVVLAGLQLVSHDLYEAARVDGANGWQSFWSITLPALRPTLLVVVIFRTIDALRLFDLIFVLTEGNFGTESLNLFTYRTLFTNLNFGMGSTLAILTFVYIMLIAALYMRVLGTRDEAAR